MTLIKAVAFARSSTFLCLLHLASDKIMAEKLTKIKVRKSPPEKIPGIATLLSFSGNIRVSFHFLNDFYHSDFKFKLHAVSVQRVFISVNMSYYVTF